MRSAAFTGINLKRIPHESHTWRPSRIRRDAGPAGHRGKHRGLRTKSHIRVRHSYPPSNSTAQTEAGKLGGKARVACRRLSTAAY